MIKLNDIDWTGSVLDGQLHDRIMLAGLMFIFVGLLLYLALMLVWIRSLMSIDLSVAYCINSITKAVAGLKHFLVIFIGAHYLT